MHFSTLPHVNGFGMFDNPNRGGVVEGVIPVLEGWSGAVVVWTARIAAVVMGGGRWSDGAVVRWWTVGLTFPRVTFERAKEMF